MKRSEINQAVLEAKTVFEKYNWTLPPNPKWDVTDFGLGNFKESGLILINLAEEIEYCEKLMYARKGQITPAHCHKKKKEDIIARTGVLVVQVWQGKPDESIGKTFTVNICGEPKTVTSGDKIYLKAGERITLVPQVYHAFYPDSDECIIGEVSTANDDINDNFFVNPDIGRYAIIDEDEAPLVKLVSDKK
jgi:D-lyxose ketol-isomerase